ncbi:hypothetical protein OSTOST_03130 [Ostertagia ostertagi]
MQNREDDMLIHLMCSKLQGYPKAVMETLPRNCREGIADYCVELEELTRRVYPDASDKELSTIRAVELITQLTEWKEYTQLSSALEQSK